MLDIKSAKSEMCYIQKKLNNLYDKPTVVKPVKQKVQIKRNTKRNGRKY